jgi:integrase
VVGKLGDQFIRRSLDTRNLERAEDLRREIEAGSRRVSEMTVKAAGERFLAHMAAQGVGPAQMSKYRLLTKELDLRFGGQPPRGISVDDVSQYREEWKLALITASKKLERLRTFFSFCVSRGWSEGNPAKEMKIKVEYAPTLPFTDEEFEKIVWAAESIREAHPKMLPGVEKKLKALVLLMRFSGIRISDAVMFRRDQVKDGKLFLRQAKTKHPVWVPLPKKVLKALAACDEGNAHYFYSGMGKPKSSITEWQDRLRKVYEMAAVLDGHSHRLRDTFAVDLLSKGVSIEIVSALLGHKNIAVTQRHYAPWVRSRQIALEKAVKATWA